MTVPSNDRPAGDDVAALRQHLDRRLSSLRDERTSYLDHWRELAEYILPRRGRFLQAPNQGRNGEARNHKIIDSTGTLAARTLASGMMAGITSPARPWFRLTAAGGLTDSQEVKTWLDDVTKRMLHVFARSNFYNSLAVMYEELGVFGTAAMVILDDPQDTIRCQPLTVGEYYLANSHRLTVDTLYREFTLTVGQVVGQFGIDACSPTLRSLHKTGQSEREVMIAHAIEPNDGQILDDPSFRGMPWRSIYWELDGARDRVLARRGFREFPVCAPRWHLVANEVYGRGPGMDALGDIKALQVEQRRKAQAIEKMVNPPMVADVSMKNQPATLLPGGVTYLPGSAAGIGFRPVYEVMPPLGGLVEDIREIQGRINQAFYANLWLMISNLDSVRTATEINERKEEKLLMLGPVLERFHAECLNPAVVRTFAIMSRTDQLPAPPSPDLLKHVQIEYVSMMAQAQKASATSSIERMATFIGHLAGSHPAVLDKINFDEAVDEYADMLGVPPKIVLPSDRVAAVRQARDQKAAQQQMIANGMALAKSAETMSKMRVGGGQATVRGVGGV